MKNIRTEFTLKSGKLSAYAFACGYVEKVESKGRWKKMYMDGNVFHVMTGPVFPQDEDGIAHHGQYDLWETFGAYELTKARTLYRSIKIFQ